jgi:hypothetical protein
LILRKKEALIVVMSIVFLIVTLNYYVVNPTINLWSLELQHWGLILAAFALGIGVFSNIRFNVENISKRKKDLWVYSIIQLISLFATILIGVVLTPSNSIYLWITTNILISTKSTITALTGLFIISACYRAFRVRNLEAGIILGTTMMMLLYYIPLGSVIWGSIGQSLGDWFLDVPGGAVFRMVMMGIAIATAAVGVRTILGKEKSTGLDAQ